MQLHVHSYPQNRLVASVADVSELGDIARRAHGHTITLVEGSLCDGLRALAADKVLWMPGLAQGGQNLQTRKTNKQINQFEYYTRFSHHHFTVPYYMQTEIEISHIVLARD